MNIFLCFDRWSTMCNVVYTSQLDAIAFSLILDTIFIFLSWFHVPLQSEIRPMPTVYVILFTNLTSKWYTRCMRTSNGDEELALFVFVSSLSLFSFIQWSIYKFLFRLVGCSIALLVLALTCLLVDLVALSNARDLLCNSITMLNFGAHPSVSIENLKNWVNLLK